MNFREAWANGEIEAGTLLDEIERLRTELGAAAAAERERWAARIEEAYREGFAARETYNDMDVNNVDEEWAKAKASLLRPNAKVSGAGTASTALIGSA